MRVRLGGGLVRRLADDAGVHPCLLAHGCRAGQLGTGSLSPLGIGEGWGWGTLRWQGTGRLGYARTELPTRRARTKELTAAVPAQIKTMSGFLQPSSKHSGNACGILTLDAPTRP